MQRHLSALAVAATGLIHSLLSSLRGLFGVEALSYRPEKHYMRGPGKNKTPPLSSVRHCRRFSRRPAPLREAEAGEPVDRAAKT